MRKSTIYRLALLVAVMLPLALASCKKDDPNPDNGTPVKPSTEISDPEGTITLSMRNADSGKTYLDNQFYIDNENFTGGYFVSLGPVKGLGNVSTIPLKGWSSQVAVIPGNGYVAYNPYNGTFYRLYVVQEIGGTSGGVIGAEVKYQKPFKGADEALSLLTTVAAIPGSGESREVLFANTTLVPFTATSSEGWCHVDYCSSYDYHFLTNGVSIWCDENLDTQPRSATVTLTTGYGKTATIAVTQSGPEPFVNVDVDNLNNIPAAGGIVDVNFSTNVDANSFSVSGMPDWLKAEVSVVNMTSRVRYIGTRAVTKQTASQYGYVRLTAEPNPDAERTATLTLKSSDGKASDSFKVTQSKAWLVSVSTPGDEMTIESEATSFSYRVDTNLPFDKLKITAPDWVKVECTSSDYYQKDYYYGDENLGPYYTHVINVIISENEGEEERTGTVRLAAGTQCVETEITQKAFAPYIHVGRDALNSIQARGGAYNIDVTTNLDPSTLQVSFSESWCTATLSAPTSKRRTTKAVVSTLTLNVNVSENQSDSPRSATVTIKDKGGNASATVAVQQTGVYITISAPLIIFDKTAQNKTITVTTTGASIEPKCDADWCTMSSNGNQLTIRVSQTTVDRQCEITFGETTKKITVKQTKYAVGDTYKVNGVSGTVGYIDKELNYNGEFIGFVRFDVGAAQWSTEDVLIGANDRYDGRKNMAVVEKIPGWEEWYPAFAKVGELRTKYGINCYLPAIEELKHICNDVAWSSTERGKEWASYAEYTRENDARKIQSWKVYAAYRFDF